MNVGIRVGWAIVMDELLGTGARFRDLVVETALSPFLEARRFRLCQVRLLRKTCLWQVDGLLQIEWGFGRHRCSFNESAYYEVQCPMSKVQCPAYVRARFFSEAI